MILAVLLAVGGATLAAAAPPHWTIAPSAGSGSRPYIYAEGAPGTVLEDKVAVTNPSAEPLTIALSAKAKDTGARFTFAAGSVKVPARTRAEIPFTLTVPAGATPGDHPGAIVASVGGRTSEVGVHLRVSGPTLSALTVEHVRVQGGNRIAYEVVNRGNTTLTPRLAVKADGIFGGVLDKTPRTLPVELLPGRRVRLSEPWHDAPALDAVDVKVTVTAGGGAGDSATATARFVPWGPLGGVLVVLAGGAFAACATVRRRRLQGRGRPGRGPELGQGTGNPRSAP